MSLPAASLDDNQFKTVLEGTARVVAVEDGLALLEPEQTTACGGCKASSTCGVDPGSARLVARRFTMPNDEGLVVGDRVVVGVEEGTVLRASAVLYGIPLVTLLTAGLVAQRLYHTSDLVTAAAALLGLAAGVALGRLLTARSSARGEHAPRFIRRAIGPVPGGDCHIDG